MQIRFDGLLGFPGGFVDWRFWSLEDGLNRAGPGPPPSHRGRLSELTPDRGPAPRSGASVPGLVRVPLYTQKDRVGGFPNFLSNAFVSTAKCHLLFALMVLNIMP
ncbi:Protein syndesmos [Heterocephalus glaber]|uniref:Protein syndesmos n=1 Tax=Heterocephalus glaber TaxID=10181 RepID=G5C0K2_HETGA|nr:Protein syndesmos [Heterocephalus glaber]